MPLGLQRITMLALRLGPNANGGPNTRSRFALQRMVCRLGCVAYVSRMCMALWRMGCSAFAHGLRCSAWLGYPGTVVVSVGEHIPVLLANARILRGIGLANYLEV